jgi:hypothetical protein
MPTKKRKTKKRKEEETEEELSDKDRLEELGIFPDDGEEIDTDDDESWRSYN